ncbi:MAG: hypothetical protein ACOYM3_11185 [Terrimicrobiaceae bacterium]
MIASQRSQMQSDVLHLTAACPHNSLNPESCPLHDVRQLSETERFLWVERLADEELEYITFYHQVCLQLKASSS